MFFIIIDVNALQSQLAALSINNENGPSTNEGELDLQVRFIPLFLLSFTYFLFTNILHIF